MEDGHFGRGEQLWFRGRRVTFVDYHRYGPHSVEAAVVRRDNEREVRVVPLWRLARDRAQSLMRAEVIRTASPEGSLTPLGAAAMSHLAEIERVTR